MGLLDVAFAPLRALMGDAEHEVERALPVREIEEIQLRVLDTAESIKHATQSIEAHVAVLESLATSIAPLTQSVLALTQQLAELNQVLGPLAGAEREASKLEHLFGRRKQPPPPRPPDSTFE